MQPTVVGDNSHNYWHTVGVRRHTINRTAYRRVYDALKRQILDGRYEPGDRIATESELCEQFGVSRITSRHALKLLEDQGLLSRKAGRGTFVCTNSPTKIPIIDGDYAGSLRHQAQWFTRTLMTSEAVKPPQEITNLLQIPEEKACWLIERIDILNGEPLAYDRAFLPMKYARNLPLPLLTEIDFLEHWMSQERLQLEELRQTIEVTLPDEQAQRVLSVEETQPLIVTTEIVRTPDESVMVVATYYRGDRVQLIATNDADCVMPRRSGVTNRGKSAAEVYR